MRIYQDLRFYKNILVTIYCSEDVLLFLALLTYMCQITYLYPGF